MEILKEIDSQNMRNMVTHFPDLFSIIEIAPHIRVVLNEFRDEGINGICYVGMGGSSIAGSYTQSLLCENSKILLQVIRNYSLPKYIDNKWIAVLTSYSGNTEETISSLRNAMDRNLRTICISSGGEIGRIGKIVIKIPGRIQPRAAFPLLFSAVLKITELSLGQRETDFDGIAKYLKEKVNLWGNTIPEPLKVASLIHHKIPLFIGSGHLVPVAYRAKCQMNENSKNPAFYAEIPEANHNEIEGFAGSMGKDILPIFLRGTHEKLEILKRMNITYQLYEDMRLDPLVLTVDKGVPIEEMLALTHYLDMVSVELADLNHVDPVSVNRINELKHRMSRK